MHINTTVEPLKQGVPNSGFWYIFHMHGRAGLFNTMWLCFDSFLLLYSGRKANQGLLILVIALSNVIKLLTTTVMVDNLAEKVDKCLLGWGCQVVCVKLGQQMLSVIQSSRISAIQRLLKY